VPLQLVLAQPIAESQAGPRHPNMGQRVLLVKQRRLLVECDGAPKYSNGGLYEGADETSFRGAFLNNCQDVLSKGLLNEAWNHKFPEQAVAYGKALLAAAAAAETAGRVPKQRRTLLSRLGLAKDPKPVAMEEQIDIVRDAGRWFVFWGERGHPIRAWF